MIELTVKKSGIVELQAIQGGQRGDLFVGEVSKQIPFPIKRFFFCRDMQLQAIRGGHAHHESRQVIFCLKGSLRIDLDDGENKQSFVLDEPGLGVLLEPMLWHEMTDFSYDCVIMVVADNLYDENDYVRDYQEFLRLIAKEEEAIGR